MGRLAGCTVALALLGTSIVVGPAHAAEVDYTLPVDGEVTAPFEAPADEYGAGHRGVDLAAPLTTPVRAAATGTIDFAGRVAGERWVTVAHPDGVRTSYGPMALVEVTAGDAVGGGDLLGTAGGWTTSHPHDTLHFSARVDGRYVDPLSLLEAWRPALVGPGRWRGSDTAHVVRPPQWEGGRYGGLVAAGSEPVSGPTHAFAPTPNRVIGLAGFTSAGGEPPIALDALGYDEADIWEFSYAGIGADGQPLDYTAQDTWHGIGHAAQKLREQLKAHRRERPNQGVDLVGHSLGGVVAMHYLLFLHDPADPELPPIANVATIASPLEGTEVAEFARAVADHDVVGDLARQTDRAVERHDWFGGAEVARGFDFDADVLDELTPQAVGAALPDAFARARRQGYRGPLATGTRVLTTGAQLDEYVPTRRSDLPGAQHLVLPGRHDGVRETEASHQVLHDFLAGEPLPDSPGHLAKGASWAYGRLHGKLGRLLRLERIYREVRGVLEQVRTPGPAARP